MKRQTEIHENLMFMQKNEMKKLRDWMTDMEDRISQMGEILFTTIEVHVKDQTMLEVDITEHQVNRKSRFILELRCINYSFHHKYTKR